jgi:hypothetical protein
MNNLDQQAFTYAHDQLLDQNDWESSNTSIDEKERLEHGLSELENVLDNMNCLKALYESATEASCSIVSAIKVQRCEIDHTMWRKSKETIRKHLMKALTFVNQLTNKVSNTGNYMTHVSGYKLGKLISTLTTSQLQLETEEAIQQHVKSTLKSELLCMSSITASEQSPEDVRILFYNVLYPLYYSAADHQAVGSL